MDEYMTPDMYAEFSEDMVASAMGGTIIGIFLLVYMVMMFLSAALGIASYILHSLGLYTIAERRQLRNKWLAWVPIGDAWLLGSISDQYQYVAKGKVKNRRSLLLGLGIGAVAMYLLCFFCMILGILGAEAFAALGAFFCLFAFFALAVAFAVCKWIAYYDLYCSCQPSNAVLYLILSIVFSVTLPFFVFFIRKKDLGMPPRKKKEPVAEPPAEEPATEIVAEEALPEASQIEEVSEETEE